jgi:hypothetical protein
VYFLHRNRLNRHAAGCLGVLSGIGDHIALSRRDRDDLALPGDPRHGLIGGDPVDVRLRAVGLHRGGQLRHISAFMVSDDCEGERVGLRRALDRLDHRQVIAPVMLPLALTRIR